MASTVQDLIDSLNEIEDKTQYVCFQYYLKEHFEYWNDDISDAAWKYACERAQSDEYFPSPDELFTYVSEGVDNEKKVEV
jgi:hypothetical protein